MNIGPYVMRSFSTSANGLFTSSSARFIELWHYGWTKVGLSDINWIHGLD